MTYGYDILHAHGLLPLRLCDACWFKKHPDSGWCYMFKDEPKSNYCAQFKIARDSKYADNRTSAAQQTVSKEK